VQPIYAEDNSQNLPPIDRPGLAGLTLATTAVRNTGLILNGPTSFPYRTCGHPQGWPHPCSPTYDPDAVKCVGTKWDTARFNKFTFYDLVEADCLDPEYNLNEIADGLVGDGTPWALATELESSPWTGNPSLQNTATLLNPGAAFHPPAALALGLQAVAATGLRVGYMVVPLHVLPAIADHLTFANGRIYGPGNIQIITGPGFTGNDLTNTNVPGQATIYFLADVVEWNVSPPMRLIDGPSGKERLWNYSFQEVLRMGKIRFNPACVYAVNICLINISCCDAPPPPEEEEGGGKKEPEPVVEREPTPAPEPEPEPEPVVEPVPEPEPTPEPVPEVQEQEPLNEGTVDQTLERVGTDLNRAREALLLEQETDRPRTTLIAALNDLIEDCPDANE